MVRRWTESVALFVILAVVGLRPLVQETFSVAGLRMTASLEGITDSWAAATLILNALLLAVVAGALLVRMVRGASGYRATGLDIGAGLMAVAVLISCVAADHKRPALNASVDWLTVLVLALALVQLLDRGWKIQLALGVIIASGVANVAECVHQYFWSFAETQANYESIRAQFWANQGVALDAPRVALFEKRMLATEATGCFYHSNVAAGYLLLIGFAALAMMLRAVAGGTRHLGSIVTWGTVALSTGFAVVLTGSTGAMVAGVAGLGLLVLRLTLGSWLARRRRAILVAGWAIAVGLAAGVVVYGAARGGLPGASLDFRWGYWTASARMFADSAATGVGAENFGDAYLGYKSLASPEEVKSPHNFVVQFATEYGVVGVLAILALLLGGSLAASRPVPLAVQWNASKPPDDAAPRRIALWGSLLVVGVFLPRIWLLPSSDPALIVWATTFPLLVWVIAFAPVAFPSPQEAGSATKRSAWLAAINCGLLAFLVQDTINFALFVPGARTTFFALLAISIAARRLARSPVSPVAPSPLSRADWVPAVGYGVFLGALLVAVVPPIRAEVVLRRARVMQSEPVGAIEVHPAHLRYVQAARLDPLNAAIPREHAEWLSSVAMSLSPGEPSASERAAILTLAQQANDEAIRRAGGRFADWIRSAKLHLLRGRLGDDAAEYAAAVRAMRRAIELYPNNPQAYVQLGDCLLAVGSAERISLALKNYERALKLDSLRPEWELYARFSPRYRAEVERRIVVAQAMLRSLDNDE